MNYIWKDWKELSRGKGIWLSLSILILFSIFILLQSKSLPLEHGFQVFLLSLHDLNVYLIPLLSLFISSFSIMQEKEQKTMLILLTKKESYSSFLAKKSISVHIITLAVFISWYFILALISKMYFIFQATHFFAFLLSVAILVIIFNQLGILWGSICSNRMQAVGANLFTWFFFIFLIDLVSLFFLPYIHYENVTLFSFFYFFDPIHTIHFYLETTLGLYPLDHMSRIMEKMVWTSPSIFMLMNLLLWVSLPFGLSLGLGRKGNYYD